MAKKKYPMKGQAEKLAKQGRYGDSMLVHMNPSEVDILRKTSPVGDLTINPKTGQPEAFMQFLPAIAGAALSMGSKSKQQQTDESMPTVDPYASQSYSDPGVELTARQLQDLYFNPEYGMINQPIPIPRQQVAGLSPMEIQARNMAGGLGGFGQQLSRAQDMYEQSARGFDPRSAGAFADPRARALYEQSTRGYDPRMGQQFMDQNARAMMRGAAGDIRGAEMGMGREAFFAQQGMMDAARGTGLEAAIGQAGLDTAGRDIRQDVLASQRGMGAAGDRAAQEAFIGQRGLDSAGRGIDRDIGSAMSGMFGAEMGAGRESRIGQRAMDRASQGIGGQVVGAQTGAMDAAQRARMQTQMAGQDLRSAGDMGRSTAMQGIAGLAGTGDQFDPSSVGQFMSPFTQNVIDAQQAEIARLGEKQKIGARDQAVRAGAFGGSRGAIAQAEIDRNTLQQQAKTGAELRSQGFQQAQQAAQQAFEQAQGRRQQAAQLTGSLGQAGAQTGISAASQAANLGLSAEQLAQRGALEGGQLGLSGLTSQADIAQRAAQMGISTEELAGRLAQQRGQLGLQRGQTQADLARQAADLGITTQELQSRIAQQQGQMGLQAGQVQGDLAQRAAQLGMSAQEYAGQMAQQGGALGLQAQQGIGGLAGQRADIAAGLARDYQSGQQLGSGIFGDQMARFQGAAAGMDRQTRGALGDAMNAYQMGQQGLRAGAQGIAGLGRQGFDMLTSQIGTTAGLGATGRGIQDRAFTSDYRAATQMADEPFMRLQRGFNVLGQGAPYMPGYNTGFGAGQQAVGTYQKPNTAARLGSALSFGAQFLPPSDVRLKENVMKVGEVEPGVGWYTWNWNDTAKAMGVDGPTEGVMAQELMKVNPSAVHKAEDGYYRVDYSKVKRQEAEAQ